MKEVFYVLQLLLHARKPDPFQKRVDERDLGHRRAFVYLSCSEALQGRELERDEVVSTHRAVAVALPPGVPGCLRRFPYPS